jgi:protein tyrosine phosphatase (PTP) superfamily phosphohydrolase (DUF442 family)
VVLDNTGLFQAKFARVGDDMFLAGQPTENGLRELRDRGVKVVVNLRTPEEMKAIPFDEAALVSALGMKYVYLPVRGDDRYPYSPETVARFADAVRDADGKSPLHRRLARESLVGGVSHQGPRGRRRQRAGERARDQSDG